MWRSSAALVLLGLLVAPWAAWAQPGGSEGASQRSALAHGLRRSWVTQARLDPATDRLTNLVLHGDKLFVQTAQGLIEALDAETGRSVWVSPVGRRGHPSTKPAVSGRYVAVINGSTAYLLDRENGQPVWERKLRKVPSGSAAISDDWVYSPAMSGHVEVFGVGQAAGKQWLYAGYGGVDVPPILTPRSFVWGTDRGHLYFARPGTTEIRFRLETRAEIAAPLSYWPPLVLVASRDGYVYAIDEDVGLTRWSFSAGGPISQQPVAVGGSIYVIPERGGMYCLAAETGQVRWFAPGATMFLAASPTHVYAADSLGNTLVLDAKSGSHLDTLATAGFPLKLVNTINDRLYLATTTGLVVCLREASLASPVVHQLPSAAPAEPQEPENDANQPAPAAAQPPANDFPGADDNPF